jgi:hypothetical protein
MLEHISLATSSGASLDNKLYPDKIKSWNKKWAAQFFLAKVYR